MFPFIFICLFEKAITAAIRLKGLPVGPTWTFAQIFTPLLRLLYP